MNQNPSNSPARKKKISKVKTRGKVRRLDYAVARLRALESMMKSLRDEYQVALDDFEDQLGSLDSGIEQLTDALRLLDGCEMELSKYV